MTLTALFGDQQMVRQLFIQQAPIGQPRQAVLIRLAAQLLTARRLFAEQRLELLDHLVHRQHYTFELRRAWQLRKAQELAFTDGFGLADHAVERTKLAPQQPATEHCTE
ncbi:hypothetical protein D3C85_1581450 [compost metagenome]